MIPYSPYIDPINDSETKKVKTWQWKAALPQAQEGLVDVAARPRPNPGRFRVLGVWSLGVLGVVGFRGLRVWSLGV